jgi:hypothetical protein
MLIKKLKALGAGLIVVLLAGCSTVSLDEPHGLCAPKGANTSPRSGDYACPEPARTPSYAPPAREAEPAPVQTAPILLPGQEPGANAGSAPVARNGGPVRVALLLPINSSALGAAAESVRAGFMASVERDGTGMTVDLVATGEGTEDTLRPRRCLARRHRRPPGSPGRQRAGRRRQREPSNRCPQSP